MNTAPTERQVFEAAREDLLAIVAVFGPADMIDRISACTSLSGLMGVAGEFRRRDGTSCMDVYIPELVKVLEEGNVVEATVGGIVDGCDTAH